MVLMDVDSVAVPVICHVRIVRHAVCSRIDEKVDGSGSEGLFEGQLYRLTPPDPVKQCSIIAVQNDPEIRTYCGP
jgi:hypothetical protein